MKMQQGIMGSHASPDLWISDEKKSKISRTHVHILWGGVPPKKKAEMLGPNIESAEIYYTKPEDEFRPGIGLNTRFRQFFFSRSQVHNLCSGVPLKTNLH
jgi:hypothetical protein